MKKSAKTIRTKIPSYRKDRQQWRRKILDNVRSAAEEGEIQYDEDQYLEVEVLLYMTSGKRDEIHDVDNRLKDIFDALQGRFRGPLGKKLRLIKNDNKIRRAIIEKRPTPKSLKNKKIDTGGWIIIRPYKRSR
jgi:Holliday junction resolvase RusA-like endonuclease